MEENRWMYEFEIALTAIENKFELTDLLTAQGNNEDYWNRIGNVSAFEKMMDEYGYHFLYEIQGLSSQIHFGLKMCLLFRSLRSNDRMMVNKCNHRYTFLLESTIHNIYAYWNRVGLFLNYYLENKSHKKNIYFGTILEKLKGQYKGIHEFPCFKYLLKINDMVKSLDRNEFTHNNSLIMQDFLPYRYENDRLNISDIPDNLIFLNNTIALDIYSFIELIEYLETKIN
jgi:hypothetical protein